MDEVSTAQQNKDTLCPNLRQPLDLTGAARQRLGHHEQQVCVLDAFGVKQAVGDSDGCSARFVSTPLQEINVAAAAAAEKPTVSSFHSPAARCRSWWCLWSRTGSEWSHSCSPWSQKLQPGYRLQHQHAHSYRFMSCFFKCYVFWNILEAHFLYLNWGNVRLVLV